MSNQVPAVHRRLAIRGDVILPGDAEYDSARRVHNLLHDRFPAVIVRPVDADDVVSAVRYASENGLTVAVRGGAHSGAGYGTIDDGLVIDLSRMRAISVNPAARVARAQGGITAGEFTAATSPHGLVTPFGDAPTVGVGGITIGGGVGYLTRKLGMTIDSLLAAEIVTADGHKIRTSETEHPDLFWAIRGGGGNFGILTELEFRLHPVNMVLGGPLFLPATRETVRGVIELTQKAPEDLTTISAVMRFMPSPMMPEAVHNRVTLMVIPVWAGDLDAGQQVLAPFRALATPFADFIHPTPFIGMYEEGGGPGEHYTSLVRSFMGNSLDDAAIDAMLDHFAADRVPSQRSMTVAQIRVLGGAMARVPSDATAFSHRDAQVLIGFAAVGFDPSEYPAHLAWVESLYNAVRHHATGSYLNFLEDEGDSRIRQAYSAATYQRLAEVKRRYDPNNLFRHNPNIAPAKA